MRGGNDGFVVKPGDLATSELYRRVMLPRGDTDAMPAEKGLRNLYLFGTKCSVSKTTDMTRRRGKHLRGI